MPLKMIKDIDKADRRLNFSVAMYSTKVHKSLNINTTRKCIMGGAFPQHVIATQHLGKYDVTKLLENKKDKDNAHPILCAQEVKIDVMCFQNVEADISLIQLIAARPQKINEASEFTNDVCKK